MNSSKKMTTKTIPFLQIMLASFFVNNWQVSITVVGYGLIILGIISCVLMLFFGGMLTVHKGLLCNFIPLVVVYVISTVRSVSFTSLKGLFLVVATMVVVLLCIKEQNDMLVIQYSLFKYYMPIFTILMLVIYALGRGRSSIDNGFMGVFSTTTFMGLFCTLLIEICLLNYNIGKKKIWIVHALFLLYYVYSSKVRTGLICAVLIILMYGCIGGLFKKSNCAKKLKVLKYLFYGVIVAFVIVYPHLDSFAIYGSLSSFVYHHTGKPLLSGRNEIWQYYSLLIAQKPLLGWGLDYSVNYSSSIHNSYLNILMQTGLVGLLSLYMVINKLLNTALKASDKTCEIIVGFTLINLVMCTNEVMLLQGQIILQLFIWVMLALGAGRSLNIQKNKLD